jgi:hypothetical protein
MVSDPTKINLSVDGSWKVISKIDRTPTQREYFIYSKGKYKR